jgi:hypothetical protein
MGPTLARAVAHDIIRQIKDDIEVQTYSIQFEIRNYKGDIWMTLGVVDAGGYKTDWNGVTP